MPLIVTEHIRTEGLCIGPFIFVKPGYHVVTLNHEQIHAQQQLEMLYVFAYLLYAFEFLILLLFYSRIYKLFYEFRLCVRKAYRNVSFEQEAYAMQNYVGYLTYRKPYTHFKLIFRHLTKYSDKLPEPPKQEENATNNNTHN